MRHMAVGVERSGAGRHFMRLAVVVLIGVAALTGTGCSDESPMELTVTGTEMAFDAPESVPAGSYVVRFVNAGLVHHEVAVRDASGEVLRRVGAAAGKTAEMEVELTAGNYELGCFEPRHYEEGMHRPLLVT